MEHLFDVDKPYFAAWIGLHDIDIAPLYGSDLSYFRLDSASGAKIPLYYAALCGFTNLVKQLMAKHPQHVNAIGGPYRTAAVAALARRHFELARVLHRNGSSVEPRGTNENTPLHAAALFGDLEIAQVLLDCGVDVNTRNSNGLTPLDNAVYGGRNNEPRVTQLLIRHGAQEG
jgi:ankyrin repeat protein